jgi:hypothetical protein
MRIAPGLLRRRPADTILAVEAGEREPQRPEEQDDPILAEASESEADESGGEREPPADDRYVPV